MVTVAMGVGSSSGGMVVVVIGRDSSAEITTRSLLHTPTPSTSNRTIVIASNRGLV